MFLAHIRGRKHKKKVVSLRKQAQQPAATAETDSTSLLTDCHINTLSDVDDHHSDEVTSI